MSLIFLSPTATTEIYTLSLHDALPISCSMAAVVLLLRVWKPSPRSSRREEAHSLSSENQSQSLLTSAATQPGPRRSEEHTSELQSRENLVCRLLLEKKKKQHHTPTFPD